MMALEAMVNVLAKGKGIRYWCRQQQHLAVALNDFGGCRGNGLGVGMIVGATFGSGLAN